MDSPNVLGMGMFTPTPYNINYNAFNNPGFTPGQLGSALGGYTATAGAPISAASSTPLSSPNYNAGTAGQLGIANTYQNLANGVGPSAATTAAQQAGQQGLAGSLATLGTTRGAGNPAAAQLAARNAGATTANNIAQNEVVGRTNEELGALGAAGGLYGNVAGQGLQNTAQQLQNQQFNAQQGNQIGQGNQATNLAANTNYLNALLGINNAQQQGQIAGQQLGSSNNLGYNTIANNAYNNAAQNNMKGLQLGGSLLGSVAGGAFGGGL